jgi:hypothetical protein
LVFGLEPPIPPEQFQVIVDQDAEEGPRETVLEAVRTDEEWHVSLRRFAGSVVRVRLVHRRGEALALRNPRVLGAVHRLPALLDSHARPPKHPINTILYVVDALRADRLSAYGYPYPTSPNLDRLASRGSLFLSAYATGPSTTASVPSLLSSRYPWELGGHLQGGADAPPTLAELFRAGGYRTGAFQANFSLPAILFGRGFDRYDVLLEKTPAGPRKVNAATLHARVLEWVQGLGGQPFFLYVQSLDVHNPYDPPPDFRGRIGRPPHPSPLASMTQSWVTPRPRGCASSSRS